MKKQWKLLAVIPVILCLPFLGFYIWNVYIDPPFQFVPSPPESRTDIAYCVDKVERVRVVHMIQGNLNEPVQLDEPNPDFVEKAKLLLDKYWEGEIVVVTTSNFGSALALSDREIAIVLSQNKEGTWKYSANIYDKERLIPTLMFTSSANNRIDTSVDISNANIIFNDRLNIWSVAMEKELNERDYPFGQYEPDLFSRSLEDIFDGRCDRIMSRAIMGPKSKQRVGVPMGEF